jgi:lipopolysaccharide export system permease protein
MAIFGRYVLRQSGGALLLILFSLCGVVWIALALRQLDLITSQGQEAWTLLKMTTLALPNLMALIAPIALLIAVMHTLNRLNTDSELIVMTASGAAIWTIARPLLFLALIVSLAVAAVNHVVMPWSLRQLREYVIEVRTDLISQVLQPGKFSTPEANLTFHIRDRTYDGQLLGFLLHDARDPQQTMSYLAESGQIIKQGSSAFLVMTNGHIIRRAGANEPPQIIVFDSYAVDLDRFEPKGRRVELKPRERYFHELAFPNPGDPEFKRQAGQFRAELHERFASPLYPFAFVLIALAFAGNAQSTRQNRVEALVIGVVAAATCRLGGLAAQNLVVLRPSAVPLLYLIPTAACLIALALMHLNARPRRRARPWDRLSLMIEDLFQQLPRHRRRRVVGHQTGVEP